MLLTRRSLLAAPLLAAQSKPPNIVLILADDLGYGDLSAYGAKDIPTPHIDALAASGVRFDHFYSNSPVCSPTRAALLTGRYPDMVGVPGVIRTEPKNNWGHLSPSAELLPSALRRAGYHSAIVGKWHLGLRDPNTPVRRGFDHFHGFLGDMMDDYFEHRRHGNNYMRRDSEEIQPKGHATDLFTGWAVDYLNARAKERNPFLLYLAYNAPHSPIQPTPESLERVRRKQPNLPPKRAGLAGLIEHMDQGVGRVIGALKANGQLENTLVVFTSDNGGDLPSGASCGPLRGGKQNMYEGGIRVPMCASWSGRIAPGSRSDRVALSMDLFPTLCEAAGASHPPIDGVSILPALMGKRDAAPERDLIWVRREGGPPYFGRDYYAVRRGNYKLLQNTPFEPYQLFNLAADPLEARDIAAQEPKMVRDLAAAIAAHAQRAGRTPWQQPAAFENTR